MQSNCFFPIKHIRSLDLLDWTLESPQQDCHKTRRTLMSPQERKIDWCTPNHLRWSTFPLHWINSRLSFHIISNKCLDILYNNPEIPWDNHLKSIGTSISVKQQDVKPGHAILSGVKSWFPVFEWSGKPSFHKHLKRSFPLGICERDPVFYASSEMDPEMPWLERSPNFPAEASCMLIVHITWSKDVWVFCRDPRKSPSLHIISKMGLTCLDKEKATWSSLLHNLMMPDNFLI